MVLSSLSSVLKGAKPRRSRHLKVVPRDTSACRYSGNVHLGGEPRWTQSLLEESIGTSCLTWKPFQVVSGGTTHTKAGDFDGVQVNVAGSESSLAN